MHVSDFDFPFDPSLIADRPAEPRDQARLLHVPRSGEGYAHRRVSDLPTLLKPGDLLVVNDTKVIPVRLLGRKASTGGKVDLVLVRQQTDDLWEALLKGGAKPGEVIELTRDAWATVVESNPSGAVVRVRSERPFRTVLDEVGHMPLPPYLKRLPRNEDRTWYQTIFAKAEGAIAAPTAGLHFTETLLRSLRERNIGLTAVTLHVGSATFRPVKVDNVHDHPMPPETIEVSADAAADIAETKSRGGRVVAVGTTVVRTLEAAADQNGTVRATKGECSLFILPGYRFRAVDAMLTNFHLPRSTLLMLVSAFAGLERMRDAYGEAVRERYRFYSYGDAMLIL